MVPNHQADVHYFVLSPLDCGDSTPLFGIDLCDFVLKKFVAHF
jgi:hypothetical protein